jgi:hypothetical protein
MSTPLFLMILIALALAAYVFVAFRAVVRMRGVRVIVCPETEQPAAVRINRTAAACSAILEQPDIELAQCSRWPERRACNQRCTAQIAIAPQETRALSIAQRWYAGKGCALCLKPIPPPSALGAQPGLLDPTLQVPPDTIAWNEAPAERLPALFMTHLPVCAHCHEREQFGMRVRRQPAFAEKEAV